MQLKTKSLSESRNTTRAIPASVVFRAWFGYIAQIFFVCQGLLWLGLHVQKYLELDVYSFYNPSFSVPHRLAPNDYTLPCRPYLPQVPISHTHPAFRVASRSLDRYLQEKTSREDIDSLIIAVVTPSGLVFQKGYGVLRANETDPDKRGTVNENSIYRIASVTKMFNVLETMILRDRGVLNWDDPITKFFPNFTYNPYSWPEYLSGRSSMSVPHNPITLRQLASHMAGLGRDHPPLTVGFPSLLGSGNTEATNFVGQADMLIPGKDELPTKEEIFEVIAKLPLIVQQYSYPIYSNLGFDLLGWVNVEANAVAGNRSDEPAIFADLMRRDVFEPVGMNSSSFAISPETAQRIAVAAQDNWDTDLDFTDSFNPSGGLYSSLNDLSAFMQTLLDPHKTNAVLGPYSVREWLRPLYGWNDDMYEVGAPWEILKYTDSTGRRQRFYQKGGNLVSHHSEFSVNPIASYGIIVLTAGQYGDTAQVVQEAIRRFHPVFDQLQEQAAREAFGGIWISEKGGDDQAVIRAAHGSLWIDRLIVNGTDMLSFLQENKPGKRKSMMLWSTGAERMGEFRIAIGRPALNDEPLAGCFPYWVSIDAVHANGAPIDLLFFEEEEQTGERVLKVPSMGASLYRIDRAT